MKKTIKRIVAVALMLVTVIGLAACGNTNEGTTSVNGGWTVVKEYSYKDIASWGAMQTPMEGSGAGHVSATDDASGFVTVHAAEDGWGGLESDYIEIDLAKDPMILVRIFECNDGNAWGMKVLPENAIEDHQWGLYVIPDNTMKWNCYAGVDLKDALGEDFISIYGEQCKVKIWIYAAGGPECEVSVSEIKVVNTK